MQHSTNRSMDNLRTRSSVEENSADPVEEIYPGVALFGWIMMSLWLYNIGSLKLVRYGIRVLA